MSKKKVDSSHLENAEIKKEMKKNYVTWPSIFLAFYFRHQGLVFVIKELSTLITLRYFLTVFNDH